MRGNGRWQQPGSGIRVEKDDGKQGEQKWKKIKEEKGNKRKMEKTRDVRRGRGENR